MVKRTKALASKMMPEGQYGSPIGMMAACRHLSASDCSKHPNCSWRKAYAAMRKGKSVNVAAGCGTKGQLTGVTMTRKATVSKGKGRGSPAQKAAAKNNPWIAHVKAYQAKNGVSYREAMKLARATYVPAQKGNGYYW